MTKRIRMMQPVSDHVLCEVIALSKGIVLPDNAKHSHQTHQILVVGIGPEVTTCKIGDQVIFANGVAQAFKFEDKEYVWLRESNVVMIIDRLEASNVH